MLFYNYLEFFRALLVVNPVIGRCILVTTSPVFPQFLVSYL